VEAIEEGIKEKKRSFIVGIFVNLFIIEKKMI
jgi:hypothetical protein